MPTSLPTRRAPTIERDELWTCLSFTICGLLAVALCCVSNHDMRRPCWGDASGFVSEVDLGLACR